MDRCCVFVDVGYLMAEVGGLCCGTKARALIQCNYTALVSALIADVQNHCGLPILRMYWYDGARDALPSLDHLKIGELLHVKVRLGRLAGGRQKGVDSLIYRDLMTLSRERAMAIAYLLAGDEDLREGVVAAQDMGVRVVLLGVPTDVGSNQADTLIRESDEHKVLPREFWQMYFSRTTVAGVAVPAGAEGGQGPVPRTAREIGVEVGQSWAERATADELLRMLGQHPRIPRDLDTQLLKTGQQELGRLDERDDLRRALRGGFWDRMREIARQRDPERDGNA